MAYSLETLCGQAFGAARHHLLGVYKQRAMVVLSLVSLPAAAVWAYTGEILVCGAARTRRSRWWRGATSVG